MVASLVFGWIGGLKMEQVGYKGALVSIESKSSFDLYQLLINKIHPAKGMVINQHTDEADFFKTQPIAATTAFERNRGKVKDSLSKLVAFVWDNYRLPRDGIIEYGSGATGYFYAELRPKDTKNWLQVEINPNAIAENLRRNPNAQVLEGSYYDIPYTEVPMIAGLSSFDTASDMPRAIDQVVNALAPEGFFLQIQDVRPGIHCVTSHLRALGKIPESPFEINGIVMGLLVDGKPITLADIFKDAIGSAIANNPNVEIVTNDYHTLSEKRGVGHEAYFLNLHLFDLASQARRRDTTFLVTLAKKKSPKPN